MTQYLVNAFAEDAFAGNPAAVCILNGPREASPIGFQCWPSDAQMQQIAKENNLSETAFCMILSQDRLHPKFHIRWFTPGCEVDLCGHATLATSYVLFKYYFKEAVTLHFKSRSGDLHIKRKCVGDDFMVIMDFPAYGLEKVTDASETEAVLQAIAGSGSSLERNRVKEIWKGIDYVAVLDDAKDVIGFKPDFKRIASLPRAHNLLITSSFRTDQESTTANYDFASRCFFPKEAIDEDPVTGSAHCTLGPLWANKLSKTELTAYQASARGGILHLKVSEDRVQIGGKVRED